MWSSIEITSKKDMLAQKLHPEQALQRANNINHGHGTSYIIISHVAPKAKQRNTSTLTIDNISEF